MRGRAAAADAVADGRDFPRRVAGSRAVGTAPVRCPRDPIAAEALSGILSPAPALRTRFRSLSPGPAQDSALRPMSPRPLQGVSRIEGVRRQTPRRECPNADEVGQYLVVTLIVATGYPEFTAYRTPSLNAMEDTRQRLGTLLAADILGLEVIWSPENPDDAMTEDELLAEYPELSGL